MMMFTIIGAADGGKYLARTLNGVKAIVLWWGHAPIVDEWGFGVPCGKASDGTPILFAPPPIRMT